MTNSSGVNTITNTTISDNQTYGACLNGNTTNTITFTSTTFSGNLPQSIVTVPHSSGFSIGTGNVLDKAIYVTGGWVDVDSTWSPQVYLLDDVYVSAGRTLTIPSGALIKFNGMTGIEVNGTLNATGNSGAPVVFTSGAASPAPGDWKGIYVGDGGIASLDYTEIHYGGGSWWWPPASGQGRHFGNLRKEATGTLTVNHSLITQSAGCGLNFTNSSGVNTITNTTISDNQSYGACLLGNTTNTITFTSTTFSGNLPQSIVTVPHSSGFSIGTGNTLDKAIYVTAGWVDVDSTWSPQVYLLDDVYVSAGMTLTIPPGALIKFNGNTGIEVNGTLNTTWL